MPPNIFIRLWMPDFNALLVLLCTTLADALMMVGLIVFLAGFSRLNARARPQIGR